MKKIDLKTAQDESLVRRGLLEGGHVRLLPEKPKNASERDRASARLMHDAQRSRSK